MGDNVSETSELISMVTDIIRGASIFNVLMIVGVSVFLVAYFDTSSLRTALGFSILVVSLVYIVGKIIEPFVKAGFGIAPRKGGLIRYTVALIQALISYSSGLYLVATSPHRLSYSAYRVILFIAIIGFIAYSLRYLDYVRRAASRLASRGYEVIVIE